ncbi:MAG: orotate phosphoribosyltransferase [Bdellovibrionia bacterium]
MDKKELAKEIYKISHLTGTFKLRSGQTSHEYFDKYRFEAQPHLLREISKQLAPHIPPDTEALAGLEVGGIPIATALSLETGLPVLFVRKKAKDYGTCQFAEGLDIQGKKLLVIEDVVTTGGQVLLSTQDLRQAGAIVDHVLCVILRHPQLPASFPEHNLGLTPLFTKEELDLAAKSL